ncbi:hypothetical protein F7D01_02475 [Erythrobacter sp. 3-20A1M]|uniref:YkvI family membrane protein n=1 Tax=Erythrobacter sp. 3-20A1M TaxID=2653850 RepID=UPI001BFCC215|nr:hypothetical protein [Erythrobacter sp. 3-20A1M]QWC56108.1 hypothetical protein F7D01_02475 [Erythrobacter sp. 3-20A1M]
MSVAADRFRRFLLPGLAFKAVVIGGGYATGRELAEFFLPFGPWGGVAAMAFAMLIWSLVAAATFAVAFRTGARDYRHFFETLLGRGWFVFEIAYAVFVVLILAVFGAAAGAIAHATLGLPTMVGTIALMVAIMGCVAFGNAGVERSFMALSVLLYATYAIFLVLSLTGVGSEIERAFASAPPPAGEWPLGGLTYAGYNIIGAVMILPVTRHFRSRRDAITAGLVAGPLAMLPALLFFVSMVAFLPDIADAVLPSDYILGRLGLPAFNLVFQLMIFAALLESGIGAVHAVNERIDKTREVAMTPPMRVALAFAILFPCMLVADRVGLVDLVASGYRALAWVIIAVYVLPLFAYVAWRRVKRTPVPAPEAT